MEDKKGDKKVMLMEILCRSCQSVCDKCGGQTGMHMPEVGHQVMIALIVAVGFIVIILGISLVHRGKKQERG